MFRPRKEKVFRCPWMVIDVVVVVLDVVISKPRFRLESKRFFDKIFYGNMILNENFNRGGVGRKGGWEIQGR